ncbi:3-mercaptopyruvate sulfurtransferase [Magnetovibrio sp. PR-2]|uniref:3-mercaptopyruvate sulfurtransferase n=1 Tax=Magnetovibrio sp. PR-2 TaxID=3120356 RepID=UPI002FCE2402
MHYKNPEALVSGEWLEQHLDAPDVRIVDATWHMPDTDNDAYEEWTYRHIPGSVHFDIDKVADTDTDLPHMLPSAEKFSSMVRKMGLGDGSKIVIYDSHGGFMAACRVWWMFRLFGHRDISILDGGLIRWGKERRPLEFDEPRIQERHFTARQNNGLVKSKAQILKNVDEQTFQLIDARNEGRFAGIDHEPRPSERRGHIPGSINIPFTHITPPSQDFTFKTATEICEILNGAGVDMNKPAAVSCGSGVTACVIAFAMYLMGKEDVAVYDGSWAEWGDDLEMPINA